MLALVAACVGAGVAVAAVPGSGGVITACVNVTTTTGGTTVPFTGQGSNLTVIDPSAGEQCTSPSQTTLTWNVTGPPGPVGPTGAGGPTGAPGATGTPGRPARREARGRPARGA